MTLIDLKRLLRVANEAEEAELYILACNLRLAVEAIADRDEEYALSRLRTAHRCCEIAMSGTEKAKLLAPGAKAIIDRVISHRNI